MCNVFNHLDSARAQKKEEQRAVNGSVPPSQMSAVTANNTQGSIQDI